MKKRNTKMIIEKKISQEELKNLIKDIENKVKSIELNKKIEINNEYQMEIIEKNKIKFNRRANSSGNFIILKVEKTIYPQYNLENTEKSNSQTRINTSENEGDKWGYMVAKTTDCHLVTESEFLCSNILKNIKHFKNDNRDNSLKLKILKNSKKEFLNIGIDTEYQEYINSKGVLKRFLISTQMSFTIDGENYINFIFFNNRLDKFKITQYLQFVIKYLDVNNLYNFTSYKKIDDEDDNFYNFTSYNKIDDNIVIYNNIKLNLLYHFTRADLTMFSDIKDLIKSENLVGIQKSLINFKPYIRTIQFLNNNTLSDTYSLNMNIRDTMNYLVGDKSLKTASSLSNIGKLDIEDEYDKSRMIDFLLIDIEKFIKYGVFDSITTVDIGNNLFGVNKQLPVTITSQSVKTFKDFFMREHDISNKDEYILKYKGQKDFKETGLVLDKDKFYKAKDYKDINQSWKIAHDLARDSYCGGVNQCYFRGIYGVDTIDFDLKNAYPTMMSTIPMIDYEQDPMILVNPTLETVFKLLQDRQIFSIDVAEVDFDFNNVKNEYEEYKYFPFIPIKVMGSLIFPTQGINVKISGAELFRALQIGAITKINIYCKIPTIRKMNDIGQMVDYPIFKNYMKFCVEQRAKYKKGTPENLKWKLNANGAYGATAQGLSGSKTNTYQRDKKVREFLEPSDMTNPIYANSITAICRVVLHDVMASIRKKGGYTVSVTTDGFISTVDEKVINTILNESELTKFTHVIISNTRYNLDGNYDYFEKKHEQKDVLSITTRGNQGLKSEKGVNAKLGIKSLTGEEIVEKYVNKEFIIDDEFEKPVDIDKVLYEDEEFTFKTQHKKIKMEYDFKRKPNEEKIRTIEYDHNGEMKDILIFDTLPWENVEDFIKNKSRVQKYYENNKKIVARDEESVKSFIKKSKILDKENIIIKEIDQYEVRCFIAQYSQNTINDITILEYFKNLTVLEQIDILNKTVKKKKFMTVDNRKQIISRAKKGLLNNLLEYNLDEYIEKLKNKIKEQVK